MPAVADGLREPERNALLRRVDWRFLLSTQETPRALDWSSGAWSRGVDLVTSRSSATADLVVLGRPNRRRLAAARHALAPGGELYCEWSLPVLAGVRRARRRLLDAGYTDVRIYWAWPPPRGGGAQFWLPVDSPAALKAFLELRPARSRWHALLRRLWWMAVRTESLAPLAALGRVPDVEDARAHTDDEIQKLLPPVHPAVLLTGGHRSINKVIAMPFRGSHAPPDLVVKFARVPEAEPGLEHEARVLRELAASHPQLSGIPRVLATSRRAGRVGLAQSAIHGQPLISFLTRDTFPDLSLRVTRFLADLADGGERPPRTEWWPRLVEEPLSQFEQRFGSVLAAGTIKHVHARLNRLENLPRVIEHRDFAPWNVVLVERGEPALLDWESAELRGLPCLDLIYFLANAAFVIEGALEARSTRQIYARMLDRESAPGRVAAACLDAYCDRIGVDGETLAALRVLCWIVHCQSEYRRAVEDSGAIPAAEVLHAGVFLGLLEEELRSQ